VVNGNDIYEGSYQNPKKDLMILNNFSDNLTVNCKNGVYIITQFLLFSHEVIFTGYGDVIFKSYPGNGMFVIKNSTFNFVNVVFSWNNVSHGSDGGNVIVGSSSKVINGNENAVIFVDNGYGTLKNDYFYNVHLTLGSVITVVGFAGEISLYNCSFENNQINYEFGSLICFHRNFSKELLTINIENCTFINNEVGCSELVINVNEDCNLIMNLLYVSFSNNKQYSVRGSIINVNLFGKNDLSPLFNFRSVSFINNFALNSESSHSPCCLLCINSSHSYMLPILHLSSVVITSFMDEGVVIPSILPQYYFSFYTTNNEKNNNLLQPIPNGIFYNYISSSSYHSSLHSLFIIDSLYPAASFTTDNQEKMKKEVMKTCYLNNEVSFLCGGFKESLECLDKLDEKIYNVTFIVAEGIYEEERVIFDGMYMRRDIFSLFFFLLLLFLFFILFFFIYFISSQHYQYHFICFFEPFSDNPHPIALLLVLYPSHHHQHLIFFLFFFFSLFIFSFFSQPFHSFILSFSFSFHHLIKTYFFIRSFCNHFLFFIYIFVKP
jgi:hypothetical protein